MDKNTKVNFLSNTYFRAFAFIGLFILLLVLSGLLSGILPSKFKQFSYGTLGTLFAFILAWCFIRRENISWASIGLGWQSTSFFNFFKGILIGLGAFLLIFIPLLIFSPISVTVDSSTLTLDTIWLFASILPLALMEEIGFRSYPQFKLTNKYGIWIGQLTIAVLFGFYHVLNGWGFFLSFIGPFIWAFVFGLSAIWSKGIAVPTGIHFMINLMQHFCGLKNKGGAILKLQFAKDASTAAVSPDNLGAILQLAILVLAIGFTIYYQKKLRS